MGWGKAEDGQLAQVAQQKTPQAGFLWPPLKSAGRERTARSWAGRALSVSFPPTLYPPGAPCWQ